MPRVLPSALGLMGPRGSRPLANTTSFNSFPSSPWRRDHENRNLWKAALALAFPSHVLTVCFPGLPAGAASRSCCPASSGTGPPVQSRPVRLWLSLGAGSHPASGAAASRNNQLHRVFVSRGSTMSHGRPPPGLLPCFRGGIAVGGGTAGPAAKPWCSARMGEARRAAQGLLPWACLFVRVWCRRGLASPRYQFHSSWGNLTLAARESHRWGVSTF